MTNWNKEELLAYILVWSANADFIEQVDEIDLILSKVDKDTYKRVSKEFHNDNDKQSIDKICDTLEKLEYSSSEIGQVFEDMKELFVADGNFHSLEQNLQRSLKKILS